MRRTNIYLDEDQLVALKHLAMIEDRTVADLVRQAVDGMLSERLKHEERWGERLDAVVERLRSRLPAAVPEDEIEADITAARDEVRAARSRRR